MEKEIINVITLKSGIIESVKSFIIPTPKSKEHIINQAVNFFTEQITDITRLGLTDDARAYYIEEGVSSDGCNEIYLIWSE